MNPISPPHIRMPSLHDMRGVDDDISIYVGSVHPLSCEVLWEQAAWLYCHLSYWGQLHSDGGLRGGSERSG